MARLPRFVVPGQPLHLTQRGNNRSACFIDSADFERYRQSLYEACRRSACAIHAYVLMTNHIHLLVTPLEECGPARMMQMVGQRYVRSFNARRHRSGTLWEGRYRSALIDSDHYLLACSRYIELNPVRARMAWRASQYRWSSYRHNADGEPDPLVTPHPLYQALGADAVGRQAAYRELFGLECEPIEADAIRRATLGGTVLGSPAFRQRIEESLRRPVTRLQHGGDRRSQLFSSALTP
jgi:putative transposase